MHDSHTRNAFHRARRCLQGFIFLATLVSATTQATPAAADSPALLQTGVHIARGIVGELHRSPLEVDIFRDRAPEAKTGFVSEDLIERVSGLINDGVRIAGGTDKGTLFVNFESHGFGGIVSLRFRR
jgi:hypothetical protein